MSTSSQDRARAEAEKQGRHEFRCRRDCEDNPIDLTMGAFCEGRAMAFADGAMWYREQSAQPQQPVAWIWKQLMHDYMGGWETKIETFPPGKYVKAEDIRDLTPLYAAPVPSQQQTNGKRLFTEDEVRAILHDMRDWISPDDGEEGRVWETRAKRHGITLDPS